MAPLSRSSARPLLLGFWAVCLTAGLAAAQQNPLVGGWRQSGWKLCEPTQSLPEGSLDPPLEELLFKADGTFSVSWTPFESYKDYWGRYRYAVTRRGAQRARLPADSATARDVGTSIEGPIKLVIDNGNFIPTDFLGTGSFVVVGKQLTLRGVRLGTRRAPHPVRLCEVTFVKQF